MAAIVGLVIIGTAVRADDRKGGASGSTTGKVVAVAADGSFVTIADKNGNNHKVHVGPDTKISADGKTVEGGVKGLKAGNTVTISWEVDTHGKRVGTEIRIMEKVEN